MPFLCTILPLLEPTISTAWSIDFAIFNGQLGGFQLSEFSLMNEHFTRGFYSLSLDTRIHPDFVGTRTFLKVDFVKSDPRYRRIP